MARISRRAALGAASALAVIGGASAAEAAATTPHIPTPPYPDAALIAACAEHIVNYDAYGASDEMDDESQNPAWQEYHRTMLMIKASRAHTMEGILAKARVTKHIAQGAPGWPESAQNCGAGVWAFDLMNDLLRLHGEIPT